MDDRLPTIELPIGEVRQWFHDLRNSFYAFRLGLEMLPRVRGDEARFQQVVQMLVDEERSAAVRLEEFAQACQNGTNPER